MPSRVWADREPSTSTGFLQALGSSQGSIPFFTFAPASVRRAAIQFAQLEGSS